MNEDIFEKLSLIEYHKYFCKPLGKKPVSKVYFAINEQSSTSAEKFFYFAELCYFIMSLPKVIYFEYKYFIWLFLKINKYDRKNKIDAAKQVRNLGNFDTVEECGNKLLSDIRNQGIRLPE